MEKNIRKFILLGLWILFIFFFLYFLQIAYERNQGFMNFILFGVLVIFGGYAYDGVKSIIKYEPKKDDDIKDLIKCSLKYFCFFIASIASFILGVLLFQYNFVSEFIGQVVALIGFLIWTFLGLNQLAKIEKKFIESNKNSDSN